MIFPSLVALISFLCLTTTTMSQEISWTIRPGCQEKCGNVTIPYPFGIGPDCSANSSFAITCSTATDPPTPFLTSINRQVVNISVHGIVIVNQPISPMSCSSHQSSGSLDISIQGSPFTISPRYNSLAVLGCTNSVWLRANETTTVGGCTAICQANINTNSNSCYVGVNCCRATIPPKLKSFQYSFRSIESSSNDRFCGYTFPVDKKWFRQDYKKYRGLQMNQSYPYDQEFVSAPLALEWEFDHPLLNGLATCRTAADYHYRGDEYADPSSSFMYAISYYRGYEYVSSTKHCSCNDGYRGNPYVYRGCVDIDECAPGLTVTYPVCDVRGACVNMTMDRYCGTETCVNTIGSYKRRHSHTHSRRNVAFISIGSALGALLLLLAAFEARRRLLHLNGEMKEVGAMELEGVQMAKLKEELVIFFLK